MAKTSNTQGLSGGTTHSDKSRSAIQPGPSQTMGLKGGTHSASKAGSMSVSLPVGVNADHPQSKK